MSEDDVVLVLTSENKGPTQHYILRLADGRPLPRQMSCSIQSSLKNITTITVTFSVDNRRVRIADTQSIER